MAESGKGIVPPYVAWGTLRNFLEGLANGPIPGRIDRSLMGSMSGGTQSQLIHALRYFDLTSENGQPTDTLRVVVSAGGIDKNLLRDLVKRKYPFLFNGPVSIETATTNQVRELFAGFGTTGSTVSKCVAFFLAACKYTEIPLSPYVKIGAPLRHKASAGRRRAQEQDPVDDDDDAEDNDSPPVSPEPQSTTVVQGRGNWDELLLAKFPTFDPQWSDELKKEWFAGFRNLMQLRKEEAQS